MKVKKLMTILALGSFLVSCAENSSTSQVNETARYRDLLLNTRNVYNLDKNIDVNNSASVFFSSQFADQLIELTLKTKTMNNSRMSTFNSDLTVKGGDARSLSLGQLKVRFNGQDITSCLISECNSTKCDGGTGNIASLTGEFTMEQIYLNLTKLDLSSDPNCSAVNFVAGSMNELKFEELNSGSGARINAQVITYNRTYRSSTIANLFAAWPN